eukprot:XP_011672222.1 PREDICTED: uncharacterized protein LOC105442103 [Strongylocentrotus purpuratus]
MTRKDLLNLLSIIFLRHSVCASTGPYDVLVPSNNGETPSLRCEFVSSAATFDRLTWTKDGIDKFVLIRDCRDTQITSCNVSVTSAPGKFSVRGDLVSGVILQVSRVTMEDDGIYECKAIILNGISITRIRLAVLNPSTSNTVIVLLLFVIIVAGVIKVCRFSADPSTSNTVIVLLLFVIIVAGV